jgi:hypothetical protein
MKLKTIIIASALLSSSLFARQIEITNSVTKIGAIKQIFQESCDETIEFVRSKNTPQRVNLSYSFSYMTMNPFNMIKASGIDFNGFTVNKVLELSFTKSRKLKEGEKEFFKIHFSQMKKSARGIKVIVEKQPQNYKEARFRIDNGKIYFKYIGEK